jgi:hypothetical protein
MVRGVALGVEAHLFAVPEAVKIEKVGEGLCVGGRTGPAGKHKRRTACVGVPHLRRVRFVSLLYMTTTKGETRTQ